MMFLAQALGISGEYLVAYLVFEDVVDKYEPNSLLHLKPCGLKFKEFKGNSRWDN